MFDSPTPTIATPPVLKIVLTSAKSRLIKEGKEIVSVIPLTIVAKTSSATLNASIIGKFGAISNNRLLSITTNVSTYRFNKFKPILALSIRPISVSNGRVTTPTTIAPSSLAISATIGALPVPVPPPSPQVIKTKLDSLNTLVKSSRDSSAAALPISGFPPAPNPFVKFFPINILR